MPLQQSHHCFFHPVARYWPVNIFNLFLSRDILIILFQVLLILWMSHSLTLLHVPKRGLPLFLVHCGFHSSISLLFWHLSFSGFVLSSAIFFHLSPLQLGSALPFSIFLHCQLVCLAQAFLKKILEGVLLYEKIWCLSDKTNQSITQKSPLLRIVLISHCGVLISKVFLCPRMLFFRNPFHSFPFFWVERWEQVFLLWFVFVFLFYCLFNFCWFAFSKYIFLFLVARMKLIECNKERLSSLLGSIDTG